MIYSKLVYFFVIVVLKCVYSWVVTDAYGGDLRTVNADYSEVSQNEIGDEKDLRLIYPGTKWCGAGNIASGYADLGPLEAEDKCCRKHDNCPDSIEPGGTRYNLTNRSFFTKLSCECDEELRRCLHQASKFVASKIGTIYFDVIGQECFREDYPIIGCRKRGGWLKQKCIEYLYDYSRSTRYQWFDVPGYRAVNRNL